MDLMRDLLDKGVTDCHGHPLGRIDDAVFRFEAKGPRLVGLEIGPVALARRLHPRLAHWARALELKADAATGRPIRLLTDDIAHVGRRIRLHLPHEETMAMVVETRMRAWLRREVPPVHGHARAASPLQSHERLASAVLGTRVFEGERQIGRIEEIRIRDIHADPHVTHYVVGSTGLLERLNLAALALIGLANRGLVAAVDRVTFTGDRAQLTGSADDLKRQP